MGLLVKQSQVCIVLRQHTLLPGSQHSGLFFIEIIDLE